MSEPIDIPADVVRKAEQAAGHITTRDQAAIVIARAIMAERHRCAKIADRTAENNRGGTNPASQAAFTVSLETARYIREGIER